MNKQFICVYIDQLEVNIFEGETNDECHVRSDLT